MRWLLKGKLTLFRGQRGISLLETMVAAGILVAIGVVFMSAMSTGYRSAGALDEQLQAEALIRSQLEDIKNSPYQDSGVYPVTVNLPPQYSVNISVEPPTCIGTADDCTPLEELVEDPPVTTIQQITVSVYHGDKHILSVACYKAKQ
jgi:Tfp pilus assembly protein PilV